jgi:hypothetical protein
VAPGAAVLDRHLVEPDPGDHPAQEPAVLGHRAQLRDDAPRHEPEVARLPLVGRARQALHQRVEAGCELALDQALVAPDAPRVDDVGARPRLRQHLGDELGRVLEIGVHQDHVVAARVVEAGRHRDLHAEIAAQLHEHDRFAAGDPGLDDLDAAVRRAVVDDDELVRDLRERSGHAVVQLREVVLLVQDRDDDGDDRSAHGALHTMPTETPAGRRPPRAMNAASPRIGNTSASLSGLGARS